jgi:hypothetical protein
MAFAGTSFGDNSVGSPGFNYTIVTASAAQAVFLLDNQNQSTPQVRLTVSNATGTTSSFLIAGVPANIVAGPASSSNNFVPTWVGTSGTQLGTGFLVTGNCGSGNQIPLTGGALGNPTSVLNQTCIPAVRTNAGTTYTQVTQSEIFICTAACTVTPIAPAAGNRGQQFCVQNDDNVASIITLAAIPGVAYENTARTSYKAANTTLASAGAIADQICIVARDSAHYNVFSFVGTWN